jgi:molecular chaperone GrpE
MAKKNKKEKVEEVVDQVDEQTGDVGDGENDTVNWPEKAAELNDKYLRLYSEFDNFRRRTQKERGDLIKSAGKDIISDLLSVVDDFDRTIDAMDKTEDVKAFTEGVKLVQQKFISTLSKQGLTHFETKGQPFDPELHEAITKIPSPSKDLKGKVVDVIEKGYMLNEKVLRYAKVVVGE